MSGGLYSMEERAFDTTLDLKAVKPYGDTMNDGKTQLSFTLPVSAGAEGVEAAKQLMKKMGFENPQVSYFKELTDGFTFLTAMEIVVILLIMSLFMCQRLNQQLGQWRKLTSL